MEVRKSTDILQKTSDKKPWVFIVGGTGETLTKAHKEYCPLLEKLAILKQEKNKLQKEFDQMSNGHQSLSEERSKLYAKLNYAFENADEEDFNANGFPDKDKIIEKSPELKMINGQITLIEKQLETIEMEMKKVSTPYNKLKKEVIELESKAFMIKNSIAHSSYGIYFPPESSSDHCHIEFVEGTHSSFASAKYDEYKEKKKYGSAISQVGKDTFDLVTAKSEDKRIMECMQSLNDAYINGELPDRIILNGHSRGASTCIELAREIYLTYGDIVTIDMILSDPVPGTGRHKASKRVIPPTVESLVVLYAGEESSSIFKPQKLDKLFYDEDKTAFTALILPMKHKEPTDDVKTINESFWKINMENEPCDKITFNIHAGKISSKRIDRIGFKSDQLPANAEKNVKKFHQLLTPNIDRNKNEISLSSDEKLATREEREKKLDSMYNQRIDKISIKPSKK